MAYYDLESDPVDRLKETFTSPYPVDDTNSEWHALLFAIAQQFNEVEAIRSEVEQNKFVTTATGTQLEKLAEIFDVEREVNQTDNKYRTRIQSSFRAQISDSTTDDIREAAAVLLDIDSKRIDVEEPPTALSPTIEVAVPEQGLTASGITASEFAEFIDQVAAVGVAVEGLAKGTFEFADGVTFEDTDNGFQALDANDNPIPGSGGTFDSLF